VRKSAFQFSNILRSTQFLLLTPFAFVGLSKVPVAFAVFSLFYAKRPKTVWQKLLSPKRTCGWPKMKTRKKKQISDKVKENI